MSLATRCSACGTVFRVVQDQLKVSEGWVRCGRCQEVFNAIESLFDLDRDAQPDAAAPPPALAATAPAHDSAAAALESRMSTQFASSSGPAESQPPEAEEDDTEATGDFADARFNTVLIAADEAAAEAEAAAAEAAEAAQSSTPGAWAPSSSHGHALAVVSSGPMPLAPDAPVSAPAALPADSVPLAPPSASFLLQAERAERWRRPLMRTTLAAAAALLALALALQAAVQFRDRLAAQWPLLHLPLAVICQAAGCELEPPRAIAAITIEGHGLSPVTSDTYRFSLTLRNGAAHEVAMPAIEIALTDANGQLVTRRVLWPTDFGTASSALAPGSESALQLLLGSSVRIAGYEVDPFYP